MEGHKGKKTCFGLHKNNCIFFKLLVVSSFPDKEDINLLKRKTTTAWRSPESIRKGRKQSKLQVLTFMDDHSLQKQLVLPVFISAFEDLLCLSIYREIHMNSISSFLFFPLYFLKAGSKFEAPLQDLLQGLPSP